MCNITNIVFEIINDFKTIQLIIPFIMTIKNKG